MRQFNIETDLEELNSWLDERDMQPLEKNNVPSIGMIEPGIAIGFVCMTDTDVGFLEGFITNSKAPLKERYKAVVNIMKWGVSFLKSSGHKRCLGITTHKSLIRMLEDIGFEFKDVKLASMEF